MVNVNLDLRYYTKNHYSLAEPEIFSKLQQVSRYVNEKDLYLYSKLAASCVSDILDFVHTNDIVTANMIILDFTDFAIYKRFKELDYYYNQLLIEEVLTSILESVNVTYIIEAIMDTMNEYVRDVNTINGIAMDVRDLYDKLDKYISCFILYEDGLTPRLMPIGWYGRTYNKDNIMYLLQVAG